MPKQPTARSSEEALDEERLLLATATAHPAAVKDMRWLQPEDFTQSLHATLWQCLTSLVHRAEPVDPVTVLWEAQHRGLLAAGDLGAGDLMALVSTPVGSAEYWGERILQRALLTRACDVATRIATYAEDPANTTHQLITGSRRALADLTALRTRWQRSTAPHHQRLLVPRAARPSPRRPPPEPPQHEHSDNFRSGPTRAGQSRETRPDCRTPKPTLSSASTCTRTARAPSPPPSQAPPPARSTPFSPSTASSRWTNRRWSWHASTARNRTTLSKPHAPCEPRTSPWTSPRAARRDRHRMDLGQLPHALVLARGNPRGFRRRPEDLRRHPTRPPDHPRPRPRRLDHRRRRHLPRRPEHPPPRENHLRTESIRYDNPVEAITEFDRLYGDAVRPGPAPATSTEHEAERARTSLPGRPTPSQPWRRPGS
ncbi:DnaB-like helicase N-terminal domain-containing protein [Streptomyces sp. M10(2022)]